MPLPRLLVACVFWYLAAVVVQACDDGFIGDDCKSPTCYQPEVLEHHDGEEGYGDTIDDEFSPSCNDNFTFSVDEFMNSVYVSLQGTYNAESVNGTLYDAKGGEIPYTQVEPFSSFQVRYSYENLGRLYGLGIYQFKLTSYDPSGCMYTVTAPTSFIVDGGFTADQRSDAVEERVPALHKGVHRSPVVNTSSWFAFGISRFATYPARPLKVGIYANGVAETDFDVVPRYKCNAGAIAGPFNCSNTKTFYHVKVMGIDTQGYQWQRVYGFSCDASGPPSTVVPPSPPDNCYNGGIMVNPGTANRECWCPMYFEGRECEIKQCMNDGTLGDDERCRCKTGYTGTYCQHVTCKASAGTQFDISSRALVFIVRATLSNNINRQQIRRAAERVGSFHGTYTAGYFMKYVLITIANRKLLSRDEYDRHQDFLTAIDNFPFEEDQGCDDSLFVGITAALDSDALSRYPYSPIFIFTDGLTDDTDDNLMTLFQQLSFLKGQLFFMLAGSNGACTVDTGNPGYQMLRYLAQFSHGLVSVVSTDELSEMTFNLAYALVRGSMIMSNDFIHSCANAPAYQSFFIDDKIEYFFIIATGGSLNASYVTPNRKETAPELMYAAGNSYIWYSGSPLYGSYILTIKSATNGPCQFRVVGRTTSNLFVALSDKLNTDVTSQQPIWRQDSHVVARISDVELSMNAQEIHAEAVIWSNDQTTGVRQALYASNGIYRDQCGYNLYFGAWKCLDTFQVFSVNIYITDVAGYTMMRTATGYCSTEPPTKSPPEGCLNGGYPNENGTCICTAFYTGDKCENIVCMNGGTILGTLCGCVAGYTGTNCQTAKCYEMNPNPWSPHGRSLTLMLHDSVTTRTTLRSISENIARVLENALSHHEQWISAYHVIRFNNTDYKLYGNITTTDGVLAAVNDIYNQNKLLSQVSCKDLDVIPMMLDVLQQPDFTPQGMIFLFLNGYIYDQVGSVVKFYEELENTKAQVNAVLLTSSPCGQSLEHHAVKTLMNFAAFSSGRFFLAMPSRAGEILRMIPTLYRSSYIYENYVENCATPQSFYFPVDSQTQAFTAYIVGDFDQDPVYYYTNQSPNYKPDQPFYFVKKPVNILKDYGTGTRLDQLIRECDDDWYQFDSHCWWFALQYSTWTEAQTECHRLGAVMATVYNAAEQTFIESQVGRTNYWTGLNDLKNLNVWEWDQFGNNTLTLDSTTYKNWAANQPPIGDMAKRCVYDSRKDTIKGWTATSCDTKMSFLCMKHVYDSEFEPEIDGSTNDLPRGIWKVSLQTQDGPCYIQIYSQSGIELYTQFVDNVHYDSGYPEPLTSTGSNLIIAHSTNQQRIGAGIEGRLEYSHFYLDKNMSLVDGQKFTKRDTDTCAYEWISDTFKCPDNSFLTLSTGVDRFGFLYQRVQAVICMAGPTGYEDCLNNGTFKDGRCYCAPGFQGMYCQEPICIHGQLQPSGTKCTCYYGYFGVFCDIPKCTRATAPMKPSPLNKTFVLAIDGTHSDAGMNLVLTGLKDVLTTVLQKAAENAGWIYHFTGIVFRGNDAHGVANISQVIESDAIDDFVDKVKTETDLPFTSAETSRPVMNALGWLLQSTSIEPRSELFIVTSGDISDYGSITEVFKLVARKRVFVNVLIVGDQGPPGGKSYNDTAVAGYFELTDATGGNFYQAPATANDVRDLWKDLISTMFDTYYITKYMWQNCSNLVEYVQVGSSATTLILDAVTQKQPTVSIWDTDGNPIDGYTINRNTATNHLVSMVTQNHPGLWKVVIDANVGDAGFCGVAVRGQSTLVVNVGFIQDTGIDGGAHSREVNNYPEAGEAENAVVVASTSGTMLFAQIFRRDDRTLLWSSPLIARSQCAYPYISANLFKCTEASFIVAIDGVDDDAHPIRRMVQVHCL